MTCIPCNMFWFCWLEINYDWIEDLPSLSPFPKYCYLRDNGRSWRAGRLGYATFTLCSRQPRQSNSKPPWTKRDWRDTTQWDEMGKRDIPWLKSQSFNPFGLCYALFLTGKAVTFHWPPWTERDGRGATPEDGMWKPAWPWSPRLPAQSFKLTKN